MEIEIHFGTPLHVLLHPTRNASRITPPLEEMREKLDGKCTQTHSQTHTHDWPNADAKRLHLLAYFKQAGNALPYAKSHASMHFRTHTRGTRKMVWVKMAIKLYGTLFD